MSDNDFSLKILETEEITHDVRRFLFEKPKDYTFEAGQATEVAIDKDGWKDEKRPFTFTSLNDWDHLEFTIKIYEDHHGVTEQIGTLQVGERFLIGDAWGTIQYKGPGTFIAGGAGVTPFIAIFRQLAKNGEIDGNKLIFSNKTTDDIILKEEFEELLGDDFTNVITGEETDQYHNGMIDKSFLERQIDNFDQHFYVCGPMEMVEDISEALEDLGASADGIVFEE